MLKINIIGAGLAGSECALYLANKGLSKYYLPSYEGWHLMTVSNSKTFDSAIFYIVN